MKKITIALLSLCLMMPCFASSVAANQQIEKNVTGTGDAIIEETDSQGLNITLQPGNGYVVSSLELKNAEGEVIILQKEDGTTYKASEASASQLDVAYRRANVQLSFDELAMRKGQTKKVTATVAYVDGDIDTRGELFDSSITFTSSNPDVVSIDPKTGVMKALKMGYSRIMATADSGNNVEDFGYVIVDGQKDKVIGTLSLFAYYSTDRMTDHMDFGHCFTMFENTSGEDITIDVSNMMKVLVPTEKYYEDEYNVDEDGYSLVSIEHVTKGAKADDSNKEAREALAASLFTKYTRLDNPISTYTIKNGERVNFGNTTTSDSTENTVDDVLFNSDFGDTLQRAGKTEEFKKAAQEFSNGNITDYQFLLDLISMAKEIGYDLSNGFNPWNGSTIEGGVSVNDVFNGMITKHDYKTTNGCSVKITRVQLEAMVDYYQYKNYFSFLERNCSIAATDAWNLVTAYNPLFHIEPNIGGLTKSLGAPFWVQQNITVKSQLLKWNKNIQFHGIENGKVVGIDVLTISPDSPENSVNITLIKK